MENLRFFGRHPMGVGFDGMAWVSLEDHYVSAIYQQQPHMYHEEGETHWEDVSFGGEDIHTFCSTCSKGSMEDDMVTMMRKLFFHEVNHMIDGMPYDDDFQLITYEMIWASLSYSVGGDILRDIDFILPLEGNTISA